MQKDRAAGARFSPTILGRLARTLEVQIHPRTRAATTIWVVTDGGEVFVRSVMGARGRWYQAVVKDPSTTLIVGKTRLRVRAVPAPSAGDTQRVSQAYRRKYAGRWPSETEMMLKPSILKTTLRLTPPHR